MFWVITGISVTVFSIIGIVLGGYSSGFYNKSQMKGGFIGGALSGIVFAIILFTIYTVLNTEGFYFGPGR